MEKSLTASEIFEIAGKCCNVFTYPEFKYFINSPIKLDIFKKNNNLNLSWETELAEKKGLPFDNNFIVIIYLSKPNYGHWCGLKRIKIKGGYSYNFLDSYGIIPDDQLDLINVKFRKKSDQIRRWLTEYLYKYLGKNDEFRYNDKMMQKVGPKIATCGRYIAAYLFFNNMFVEDFIKFLESLTFKTGLDFDHVITYLTT